MEFQINYQEEIKQQLELAKKQELVGNNPTERVLELLDIDPTNEACIDYLLDYELKVVKIIYEMKLSGKRTNEYDNTAIDIFVRNYFNSAGAGAINTSISSSGQRVFSLSEYKKIFLDSFITLYGKRNGIEKNIKACNNQKFELKLNEIKKYKKELFDYRCNKTVIAIKEYNKKYENVKEKKSVSILSGVMSALVFILSIIFAIAFSSFGLFILGFIITIILCVISSAKNVKNNYIDSEIYYNADKNIINIID